MKPVILLIAIVFTFATGAFSQNFTEASKYNDYIVELQNKIGYKMLEFNERMGEEDATLESVTPYHTALLQTTKDVIADLKKMPAFEGNTSFRNSAIDLFNFYLKTIEVDYKEMMELIFAERIDDASLERLNQILEQITEEEAVYDENFAREQQAFADKYNFDLIDNELQEEIDELDEEEETE